MTIVNAKSGTDIDGDVLTYSLIDTAPLWLTINSETGEFSGQPGPGDVTESVGLVYYVSDAEYRVTSDPFSIDVMNVNDRPVISGEPSKTVLQDALYVFKPVGADLDSEDNLTYRIANQPDWSSFNVNTGELSGTPDRYDVRMYPGIEISVSDGLLRSSTLNFHVNVLNVNDAPVVDCVNVGDENCYYTLDEDTQISIDIYATHSYGYNVFINIVNESNL